MTDQQFKGLQAALDSRIAICQRSAASYAVDFVTGGKPEDKQRSLTYIDRGQVWEEAKRLILSEDFRTPAK